MLNLTRPPATPWGGLRSAACKPLVASQGLKLDMGHLVLARRRGGGMGVLENHKRSPPPPNKKSRPTNWRFFLTTKKKQGTSKFKQKEHTHKSESQLQPVALVETKDARGKVICVWGPFLRHFWNVGSPCLSRVASASPYLRRVGPSPLLSSQGPPLSDIACCHGVGIDQLVPASDVTLK